MAVPELTSEQRKAALEKAAKVRRKRADFLASVRDGDMAFDKALDKAMGNDDLARIHVRHLIMTQPGIGKSRCKQVMDEIGIAENRRVGGLGHHQVKALKERFA